MEKVGITQNLISKHKIVRTVRTVRSSIKFGDSVLRFQKKEKKLCFMAISNL